MNWYLVWIAGFLLVLLVICVKTTKSIETADDFVMADFKLGFLPVCGSVIATVTGSAALIGGAGKGFELGISNVVTVLGYTMFTIVAVLVLGKTVRRLRLYTVPELFKRRFGTMAALIPALIIGFLYMTPTFGIQLVGMSSILSSITDVSTVEGIFLGFLVTIVFTAFGGLPSVAWTDTIQTVVILAGVVITFVLVIAHLGGPATVMEATPSNLTSFGSIGGVGLLNWFLVFGPFYIVWQTTWQRLTAARSTAVGISGVVIGFVISGVIGLLAIVIGIAAVQEYPAGTNPDAIYTSLIADLFPGYLGGLFMVSLLAALLTGATSFLLSGAINISKDIYEGLVNPGADDLRILRVSRISVGLMAVLGLGVALWVNNIIAIYEVALSFTASALVMPFLATMFWERATKAGVITSTVGSVAVALAWNLAGQPFGVHEIAPGLVTSAVLLGAVSILTSHSPDEEVVAYYQAFKRGDLRDAEPVRTV